jgi:hypothetical protein
VLTETKHSFPIDFLEFRLALEAPSPLKTGSLDGLNLREYVEDKELVRLLPFSQDRIPPRDQIFFGDHRSGFSHSHIIEVDPAPLQILSCCAFGGAKARLRQCIDQPQSRTQTSA